MAGDLRKLSKEELIIKIMNLQDEIARLRDREIEASWERNPDRMGGSFSDLEIIDSLNDRW